MYYNMNNPHGVRTYVKRKLLSSVSLIIKKRIHKILAYIVSIHNEVNYLC